MKRLGSYGCDSGYYREIVAFEILTVVVDVIEANMEGL
jgi:hypothetical protein